MKSYTHYSVSTIFNLQLVLLLLLPTLPTNHQIILKEILAMVSFHQQISQYIALKSKELKKKRTVTLSHLKIIIFSQHFNFSNCMVFCFLFFTFCLNLNPNKINYIQSIDVSLKSFLAYRFTLFFYQCFCGRNQVICLIEFPHNLDFADCILFVT